MKKIQAKCPKENRGCYKKWPKTNAGRKNVWGKNTKDPDPKKREIGPKIKMMDEKLDRPVKNKNGAAKGKRIKGKANRAGEHLGLHFWPIQQKEFSGQEKYFQPKIGKCREDIPRNIQ